MTELRFAGDWSWGVVIALAAALAAAAWFMYRRELARRAGLGPAMRRLLAGLRSLAVFLLVLMLAGPVLHHVQRTGELARLVIVADASQSMNLRDPDLAPARKALIARRLGWLDPAALDDSLARAADGCARIRDALTGVLQTNVAADRLQRVADEAAAAQKAIAGNAPMIERITKEIVEPAAELKRNPAAGPQQLGEAFTRIAGSATVLEQTMWGIFASGVATNDERIKTAVARFDSLSRWQRLQALLFDGQNPALKELAASHDVELKLLRPGRVEPQWQSRAGRRDDANEAPVALGGLADGKITDVNLSLTAADDADHPETSTAAVTRTTAILLLSDGKHNAGESPIQRSKVLGSRGVKVFTVGLGATNRVGDLAVAGVVNPKQVFVKDRLRGSVMIKDDMPAGRPFTVRVLVNGDAVWEKEYTTQGMGVRALECDFPVEQLAEKMQRGADKAVARSAMPVDARVVISEVEGDRESRNNAWPMRFNVSLQKHRMLFIEGRARWDWRYLHNMFARDEQWEVTSVMADAGDLPRGDKPGAFPASREALFAYDLVYLGEVSSRLFKTNELAWIADFVGDRAGGLIVLDGQRKDLRTHLGGPLGPLLPVEWVDGEAPKTDALRITEAGRRFAPFAGVFYDARPPAGTDAAKPPAAGAPAALAPPKWIAQVRALPGSEVLCEAVSGAASAPALVMRRFGAGRVYYAAFDESWRWRTPEPEVYHQRYWRQLALAVMEAPFAVRDPRVSLDTDAMSYGPGQQAGIRARLRDAKGRPLAQADAYALLARNGQIVASLPFTADESGGGLYHARTAELEAGDYEVRVAVDGVPDAEIKARATFHVAPADIGELTDLGCDEGLLREIAANGNGGYFREENLDELVARLRPLSSGRVVESETVLWQSYWWFSAVLGMLTAEWILRKRSGLL